MLSVKPLSMRISSASSHTQLVMHYIHSVPTNFLCVYVFFNFHTSSFAINGSIVQQLK